MSRAWTVLVAAIIALALCAGLLLHAPRAATPPAQAAAPRDSVTLSLVVRDGDVTPAEMQVALGKRVHLDVTNRGTQPAIVSLLGYDDRVHAGLAPGATETITFDVDRPGDDFAWKVDGKLAGRFRVAGSHLVEGHR
jgi:hypothetical protein